MSPTYDQDPALSNLDPLPGRVIAGNFRIEKLIGAGAMGNVYRAEQLSLNKAVAVKVLHHHLMSDDKLVARFKREAKSASLLNHPNSIQIIDSGQDGDGLLYIAMELLVGRDLAQVIRDDFPLPLPRVVRIMTQVFAALDEAHAQGVIHRDLKPSNIMLVERRGEKDFVKVCDFGIAKATESGQDDRAAMLTIQGLVCGTPEYMSPEQARAEAIDGRSDLYSAAVILYQLATGDIPFRADSPMGIVSRHLAEPPVPPSVRRPDLQIPALLDDIILRGMEKARELRFPTALAFREALEVMLNATLGPPTPLPPGIRASMPTAPAMRGSAQQSARPGSTGELPTQPARDRFGTTADMTGQRGGRGNKVAVVVGTAVMFSLCAVGAIFIARFRHEARPVPRPNLAAALSAPASPAAPAAPPSAAAEPVAVPPREAPAEEPVAASPAATTPAREAVTRHRLNRRAAPAQAVAPAVAAPAPDVTPSKPAAPAVTPAAAPPVALAAPEPAPRGPREILTEADKLLAQGEVADACARGEEAKRVGPKLAAVYKFLGKCYMRAGKTSDANDNYRQYLELAPGAPDAPFVKSMIK
jgi:eukaryotic-like serine/threonine-protein kinase